MELLESFDWRRALGQLKQYRGWIILAVSATLLAGTGCAIWFVPPLRAKGEGIYGRAIRYMGMGESSQEIPLAVSPTADLLAPAHERIGELEKIVRQQGLDISAQSALLAGVEDRLKQAVAEVASTNDILTKQQQEWLATLRRVGVVAASPAPKSSGGSSPAVPSGSTATVPSPTASAPASTNSQNGKLNINAASVEDFDALPGIGPSYAQRIVDYRAEHGAFTQIEGLMDVSGIGQATFDKIKDLITL